MRRCALIVAAAAISCIFLLLVREATGSLFVWDLVLLAGPFSDLVGGLRIPCCFGVVWADSWPPSELAASPSELAAWLAPSELLHVLSLHLLELMG